MAERSGSPGWSDLEEMGAEYRYNVDHEESERRNVLRHRKRNGDWCKCGGHCFPPSHPKTDRDVLCCTEIDSSKFKLTQNTLFGDMHAYKCITKHPAFKTLCGYYDVAEGLRHVFVTDQYNPRLANTNKKPDIHVTVCILHGFMAN